MHLNTSVARVEEVAHHRDAVHHIDRSLVPSSWLLGDFEGKFRQNAKATNSRRLS
jgi:hypothetical protein